MKPLSESRYRFNLLLAVWMAAVGMGVSVSHAHLLGGQPHTHALGWFAASSHRLPAVPSGNTDSPHRHLLLLGVELAGESTPDATGTGPAVDVTGIGATETHAVELPVLWIGYTPFLAVDSHTPVSVVSLPPPAVCLCHFARRAMTGVLRT